MTVIDVAMCRAIVFDILSNIDKECPVCGEELDVNNKGDDICYCCGYISENPYDEFYPEDVND